MRIQFTRIQLNENTAYKFAKLQQIYGNKSYQRTFDEALKDTFYMDTQGVQPVKLATPEDKPEAYDTTYNLYISSHQYEIMFLEIKRRLSLGKPLVSNVTVIEYIIDKAYSYYSLFAPVTA